MFETQEPNCGSNGGRSVESYEHLNPHHYCSYTIFLKTTLQALRSASLRSDRGDCDLRFGMEASLVRTTLRRAPQQLGRRRLYSTVQDLPRTVGSFTDAAPPAPTRSSSVFDDAVSAASPRYDWTREQISQIHQTSLMELTYAAVGIRVHITRRPLTMARAPSTDASTSLAQSSYVRS
jgi:hypothetical protein